eukprot:CAMPEP_0170074728 /NCGR_PEP_ID=MMETSP0019_2-20121128/11977_1 /TAXON_ID=98059 /ORGANISM="Dinobryon sp., Strain UTEXLB2267" /LENGTH=570 /DNA_ID=CAMNT_0010285211 /DNA_START=45 /DNA_END=1757 /DNA_ORIENTATION=-
MRWLDKRETDLRWFRIQEAQGTDQNEYALCYYRGKDEKEAKGWIYLKDVTEIFDEIRDKDRSKGKKDVLRFTVVSPGRTIVLDTNHQDDTFRWVQALVDHCPSAQTSKILLPIARKQLLSAAADRKASDMPPRSAADNKRSASLFSRNGDDDGPFAVAQTLDTATERHGREDLEADDDDVDEAHEADRRGGPRQQRQEEEEGVWFESLGDSRQSRGAPPSSSAGPSNPSMATIGKSESFSRDQRDRERDRERDDHRKSRSGPVSGATTARLHRFITGAGAASAHNSDSDNPHHAEADTQRPARRAADSKDGEGRPNPNRRPHQEEGDGAEGLEQISLEEARRVNSSRHRAKELRQMQAKAAEQEEEPQAAPSSQPRKLPPPTSSSIYSPAAPRRARDEPLEDSDPEDGPSGGPRPSRQSVEGLLAQHKPGRGALASQDDQEELDLKAELRRYTQSVQGQEGGGTASAASRPPRAPGAPVGVKAPYQPLSQLATGSGTAARSGTPPRQAADPGAKTDANFVNEDWDDDDGQPAGSGPGRRAEEKPAHHSNTSRSSAGMKVDANWLQEDFDD